MSSCTTSFLRNLKEFERSLAPSSTPPRSHKLLTRLHLHRDKTDRRHAAKPIEGEDTLRGLFAACSGYKNIPTNSPKVK